MKCPKCSFNSFDGLDSCKKCGVDLEMGRERSGLAGRFRRSREPQPVPEDDGGAEPDLPFEPEDKIQGAGPDAVEVEQGELFSAGSDEATEPEVFAADISEEFTAASGAADFSTAVKEGEEAPGEPDCPDDGENESAVRPAPWKPRLMANAVDLSVLALLIGLFVLCGNLALAKGSGGPAAEPLLLPYLLVCAAVCFVYFTFFHYLTGQSPGKMLFGLLVECRQGGALSFSQAFLRSFGGGLSLLGLGFGFAPILWRPDGRGWNDRLAGSRVVFLADAICA